MRPLAGSVGILAVLNRVVGVWIQETEDDFLSKVAALNAALAAKDSSESSKAQRVEQAREGR